MNDKKQYLDDGGVLFYTQKLKLVLDDLLAEKADETEITEIEGILDQFEQTLATKVDKIQGKGLSTNDLTDALVQEIHEAGKKATLDGIPLEGTLTKDELGIASLLDLSSEATARSNADNTITNNLTSLGNDVYRKAQTYTKTETDDAIAYAIGQVTQIRYEIVQELPQVGENGVIYLVQYAQTPQGNVYQEWIWLATSQRYETLGSTNQIDLSNYITFDDIEEISNSEITDIFNSVFNPTPVETVSIDFNVSDSIDLFGKVASDLQSNVAVASNAITGTLNYIDDYTGFSSVVAEQSGNYLVLHVDTELEDDIYVELVNGTKGPVQLDEDRLIVLRIADKDTQSVRVTVGEVVKLYTLDGLTITPANANNEEPGNNEEPNNE